MNTEARRNSNMLGLLSSVLLLAAAGSAGAGEPTVTIFFGAPYNFDSSLAITQKGQPDIDHTASFASRPFELPLYWMVRTGFDSARDDGAWEIQLMHHKLFLDNPTPEVEHFQITHGCNILAIDRSFTSLPVDLRIGAGLILAHTESKVRGLPSPSAGGIADTGYELAGPTLLAGVGKQLELGARFSLAVEAQLTASWVRVRVAEGRARMTSVSAHGLIGLGYQF